MVYIHQVGIYSQCDYQNNEEYMLEINVWCQITTNSPKLSMVLTLKINSNSKFKDHVQVIGCDI